MGFFQSLEMIEAGPQLFRSPQCGSCGLFRGCRSPKMGVHGAGRMGILVVGEAPGETEDERGIPFVGKAGHRLQTALGRLGVDLFEDCWVVNALRCRPPSNKIPKPVMIDYCRPFTLRAIEDLAPTVVILLGNAALRSVVGHLWREDPGGIQKWMGYRIPSVNYNAWVCPALHPSFLDRKEGERDYDFAYRLWENHLRRAVRLARRRPYTDVPNYEAEVQVLHDPAQAAAIIDDGFRCSSDLIAFDYETTCKKPQGPHAEIVSCSLSDGATTIAYPWQGAAVAATRELLQDKRVGKISQNEKFEETWTRRHLGVRVRGWRWDTMLAAHALDARPGTTGFKFQAFTRLGVGDYARGVTKYLESDDDGGNTPNRVRELARTDLRRLLLYNSLDSLLEFKVAERQAKELGMTL